MKTIKQIAVFLLLLFLLFAATGFIISVFYEEEVKEYIVGKINDKLEAEVNVDEIELSFFQKFPYISLEFSHISAKDAIIVIGEPDTLFYFEKAYLQFNIIDIIQKNYQIRKIDLNDGFIRLKIDKNGYENYRIWKSRSKKEADFLLELEDVSISNTDVSYLNETKNDSILFHANEINLNGKFYNEEFLLVTEGDLFVSYLIIDDVNYLSNHKLYVSAGLDINKLIRSYTFHKGKFTIDRTLNFGITGKIVDNDDNNILDLAIQGNKLDIISSLALLPEKYRRHFDGYDSKGIVGFNCTIKGEMSKTQTPALNISFEIAGGTIRQKSTSYELTEVMLKGRYTNGDRRKPESSILEIEEMDARLGKGNIHTKFKIRNFERPEINLSLIAEMQLHELQQFIQLDTLENVTGKVSVNVKFEGKVNNLKKFSAQDFRKSKSSGKVTLTDAGFKIIGSPLEYRKLSGTFLLHNNDMLVKELSGYVSSTDFRLNGLFRNMLAFLFLPGEKLTIEAELSSNKLNLNEMLTDKSASNDTAYALAFPNNIHFNFNVNVGQLNFRKFNCSNLKGIIQYNNKILSANPLSFNTMGGSITGSCKIDASDYPKLLLTSNASAKNIDVQKLFHQFENFGQDVITERHLKGTATADIQFAAVMNPALELNPDKVYADANISIVKGELIAFEPMNDIADYFKKNKLLAAFIKADVLKSKLQHIKFSQLNNRVLIKQQKVHIPAMEIKSSALDIKISGTHTFGNEIDYKLNFYLTDLFTRKGKQPKEDFGYIKDDGLGKTKIFLRMTGTIDNPDIRYDKKGLKQNIKQELKKEKQTVKSILKEEFGLFKKDTTLKGAYNSAEEINFIIEWEEAMPDIQASKDTANGKKKKGFGKFLNKLKSNDKEENEGDFEFDDDDF